MHRIVHPPNNIELLTGLEALDVVVDDNVAKALEEAGITYPCENCKLYHLSPCGPLAIGTARTIIAALDLEKVTIDSGG